MITVLPCSSAEEIAEIFGKFGFTPTENSGCVTAKDKDEVLGYCLYELYEKGITILDLTPRDDIMLADGILRSALHVAATISAMDARYAESAPEELFTKLGFVKNADERTLNIDLLFGGCPSCGK